MWVRGDFIIVFRCELVVCVLHWEQSWTTAPMEYINYHYFNIIQFCQSEHCVPKGKFPFNVMFYGLRIELNYGLWIELNWIMDFELNWIELNYGLWIELNWIIDFELNWIELNNGLWIELNWIELSVAQTVYSLRWREGDPHS